VAFLAVLLALLVSAPGRVVVDFDDFKTRSISLARALSVVVGLLATGAGGRRPDRPIS
jgi:hypothetical protein